VAGGAVVKPARSGRRQRELAFDPGYVQPTPAWPSRPPGRAGRDGKTAHHIDTVGTKCSEGCGARVHRQHTSVCPNCERHLKLVDAMKVMLEYETEWVVSGCVFKDEKYLTAKEYVQRWNGALR